MAWHRFTEREAASMCSTALVINRRESAAPYIAPLRPLQPASRPRFYGVFFAQTQRLIAHNKAMSPDFAAGGPSAQSLLRNQRCLRRT